MTRKPPGWTALPILIGGLLLAACSVLLGLNLLLALLRPGHPIKLAPGLFGATSTEAVPTGLADVLNGRMQAAVGRGIGGFMPLYPAAVRLRNDLEFTLFGVSAEPSIVVVRDDALLEQVYIDDWCSRSVASFVPGARLWAQAVRRMQDAAERRGQTFLYVLTPSKLAQYPALLPSSCPCRSTTADRDGLVPAWMALLRQVGVHTVDTTAIVRALHGTVPFRLYPRGGIHWNWVGAAAATQAVLQAVDRQRPGALVPFGFTWHMAPPDSTDSDLALLMNLSRVPDREPTPSLVLHSAGASDRCRPLRVAIVGGSFTVRIAGLLGRTACAPSFDGYLYWHSGHLTWSRDGHLTQGSVDPVQRAAALRDADVLLYEENEQLLGHAEAGRALSDALTADGSR